MPSAIFAFNNWLTLRILLLCVLFVGCSTQPPPKTLATDLPYKHDETERSWWYARFHLAWPADNSPDWGVDGLLAHQIIKPILIKHAKEVPLWRFHRRAVRDSTGRTFSFIFFAPKETAASVYQELFDEQLCEDLNKAGILLKLSLDDIDSASRSNIEDVSDKRWSIAVQRAWPSYIMGVSALWLGLIDEFYGSDQMEDTSVDVLLSSYRKIHEQLSNTWKEEGRHAFLHHLNAIFAYEPLPLEVQMNF